jgi:TPR repeat protein
MTRILPPKKTLAFTAALALFAFSPGVGAARDLDVANDYDELVTMAERGNSSASFLLGTAFYNGKGAVKDIHLAFGWFKKAAEQGDAEAQFKIGKMYFVGEGVDQSHAAAAGWYRRAADQGHSNAQFWLGMAYALGEGIGQDFVQAYLWFSLNAASPDNVPQRLADSISNRDIAAENLTPAQLAEAQKLVRDWVRK